MPIWKADTRAGEGHCCGLLLPGSAGDTYRVVYTVRFKKAVYVLHAFQKKSKRGAKTPKKELDLIKSRLLVATQDYKQGYPDEA